ncbi:MAG TPA: D-alanyl-D-alanine carboxypeptidase/D-alanyl-D-alanine-endopeptidase [Bryobacteraceae bacterium]|nr:D-alanyl-D-alanine carboxypeptidase/D-alanyl-D-alanine-endopeptidase [Bryobacteraceae bacterium]
MRNVGALIGLFLFAGSVAPAQTVRARIERILAGAPNAIWGIQVVDLQTGATVYARNEHQLFVPASNAKLFSTALALTRLGPHYRFRTLITAPAALDADGRVTELRLVGGGDPNLSGRVIPYNPKATDENPLRHVEQFAQQLVDAGLRHVQGDIVADVSAYANEPFPEGWAVDDPLYSYGAPVTSLFVNDGTFKLGIAPTTPGDPPVVTTSPSADGMVIHNQATTGTTTDLKFARLPASNELTLWGSIAAPKEYVLAVDDPALFAAQALREALLERGVRIAGVARVDHAKSPAPGVALVTYESQPLVEALKVINKDSVNLHAEIVLLETGRVRTGAGTRKAAIEELREFLKEAGVNEKEYTFEDGSGLSRKTLVSPSTVVTLLRYMYGGRHRDAWIAAMPIGGLDGTLEKRFARHPNASRIRAKTGSLSHVNALSGYAGDRYAFSILANNSNVPALTVRTVIDRIALALLR